jgi:hypothetical protein
MCIRTQTHTQTSKERKHANKLKYLDEHTEAICLTRNETRAILLLLLLMLEKYLCSLLKVRRQTDNDGT